MSFVPIEYDCLCGTISPEGRIVYSVERQRTAERDHYEWLRPPTQIHYFQKDDGSWIDEEVAARFASGEWVDTHDGGFLMRGKALSEEEVRARLERVGVPGHVTDVAAWLKEINGAG